MLRGDQGWWQCAPSSTGCAIAVQLSAEQMYVAVRSLLLQLLDYTIARAKAYNVKLILPLVDFV